MPWPENRTEIENGFADDLEQALRSAATGDDISEEQIEAAVAEASRPWLETTAQDAIFAILLLLDGSFGPDALKTIRAALDPKSIVSPDKAAQLIGRQVAANTTEIVGRMRRENVSQGNGKPDTRSSRKNRGGLTPEQRDSVFGRDRAYRIAVTETTRMAEVAEKAATEVIKASGVAINRIWVTAEDDRVCKVCGPMHGLYENQWPSSFRNGPPLHPNCRCRAEVSGLGELVK